MVTTGILADEAEWEPYHPVVADFWGVDRVAYLDHCSRMADAGYVAFGLRDGEPTAFAGGYPLYCSWYGEFLWLVDLVVRPGARGRGYGSTLYDAVERWAVADGHETIVLGSALDRTDAHEFYRERGFEVAEHWFVKSDLGDAAGQ